MTATQKRIVAGLASITALVFVATLFTTLGNQDDGPAAATPPSATVSSTTATSEPVTTTAAPADDTISTSSTTTSTSAATTSTTTTTTTTTAPPPALLLQPDGLGAVPFGTEADEAISAITAVLGSPDEDSGWIPSFSGFGTCPGEQVRGLRWATMWVLLTDGATEWRDDGVPHVFTYLNSVFFDSRSIGLLTPEGLGLGDPVEALRDAYGGALDIRFDELADGYVFSVALPAPQRLSGALTGEDNDDLITSIDGGWGCGE